MLFVQGVGVVFLIAYTTFAALQWCANKKAADAAKSSADTAALQLELAERPNISMETIVASDLTFSNDGAKVTVVVTSKNTGNTAAKGVWVRPELYIRNKDKLDSQIERKHPCEKLMQYQTDLSETILPNDSLQDSVGIGGGNKDEIAKSINWKGGFVADVIVCAVYRPIFKEKARYYTASIYRLRKQDSEGSDIFKNGENVPAYHLFLESLPGSTDIQ